MFKYYKKLLLNLERESFKLDEIMEKTENHFNKVHSILFKGETIGTSELVELESIMDISMSLLLSRMELFFRNCKDYDKKQNNRLKIVVLFYIVALFPLGVFLPAIIFPTAMLLYFLALMALPNGSEIKTIESINIKMMEYMNNITEFEDRYNNYIGIICQQLDKRGNDIVREDTCQMALINHQTELMKKCICCINDFIDGKITLNDIPAELKEPISFILKRDLGENDKSLSELLMLAKEQIDKKVQERSRQL